MYISITAIVCTYNRADLLSHAIESLAEQTITNSDYEILVVDNGSDDATRQVVEKKQRSIPNLRYVYEQKLGLSRARNAGIASSKGRFLAFLDDDAIACRTWLEHILKAFRTVQPRPGLLCGPVEPIWGNVRPDWLKDDLLSYYSVLSCSEYSRPLQDNEWVVGANMAVPRDVIRDCGGFDEKLGRKGKSLLSGEETALTNLIKAKGYSVYYEPALVVGHYIHPARLSKAWFYRRIFWGGVSMGILERRNICERSKQIRYAAGRGKFICRRLWSNGKALLNLDHGLRLKRDILRDLGRLYGFFFLAR